VAGSAQSDKNIKETIMEFLLVRHLWGIPETWEQIFPLIKASGYHAIESPLPAPADRARFRALLDQYGLGYIAMLFTGGATPAEHADSFRSQAESALGLRPILINSHSGQDAWDEDQSVGFFAKALEVEAGLPISVAHETHRGRIFFNPWITQRMIRRFQALKLCCDLSHWVCVCERLLDDQLDLIGECARRCILIHARVGYEQGPQAPDPRAPEYQRHVEAHERWWDMIWDAQAAGGLSFSPLTPEFGPPDYLHTLPYSRMPVADLAEICNWQARRQSERFAAHFGERIRD
jgi:hypothetical protein